MIILVTFMSCITLIGMTLIIAWLCNTGSRSRHVENMAEISIKAKREALEVELLRDAGQHALAAGAHQELTREIQAARHQRMTDAYEAYRRTKTING